MTQIEKLEELVKDWKHKSKDFFDQATYCRRHNFLIESQILSDKAALIDKLIIEVEIKVINEYV